MTLACVIDAAGITAPAYPDLLASLQASFRSIYGSDVYLEPDSQDGQWLAILAAAMNDTNAAAIAAYNAFSPSTAQGGGLSSVVKINGISRAVASRSTVDVLIVGQAGTVINNGIVSDVGGTRWDLPTQVVIPLSGQITATATAETIGAITAAAGTLTTIATPTRGWQTCTNSAAATPGAPVEGDDTLQARQTLSTALPSQTGLDGMIGAVSSVPGVLRLNPVENQTGFTSDAGVPEHSVAFVVDGGDALAVATAILRKKSVGAATYGTTVQYVTDANGYQRPVRFFRPTSVSIDVTMTVEALPGFTTVTQAAIAAAVGAYINALPIGAPVLLTRLYSPANNVASTFAIQSFTIGRAGGALFAADVALLFNEAAHAGTITVQPV